jgi:hypothetical protein
MNESTLRWKGRLGSLKPIAALVLLFAVIFLLLALSDLSVASSNPSEPEGVDIARFAAGEIGASRYVSVSGTAFYPAAYEETEDSRVVSEYYFVVDTDASSMVLVEADGSVPIVERSEEVTISGMTRNTPSDLKALIESDLPDIRDAGLETSPSVYIQAGQKPADVSQQTALVGGLGVLSALCVATFFFPGTVFGPKPVDISDVAAKGAPVTQATGQFQKLSSVRPSIQIGKGTRKFSNSVANIIPLEDRRLMIYVHHILTTKAYGVTVNRQESDWGAFIDSANVIDIEPGKVYSWKDRWAVRLRYKDEKEQPQTLFVMFNQPGLQSEFVGLLRQMGFAVGMGEAPMM